MTLEQLSSKNAQRNERRMAEDVLNSGKIARPPRVQPPLSSRGSFSYETDGEESDTVVSARVAEVDKKTEDGAEEALDERAHVERIMTSMEKVKKVFNDHTSSEDRALVRLATCPSNMGMTKSLYSNPVTTLVLSSLISALAGVLVAHFILPRECFDPRISRGVSHSCQRVISNMIRHADPSESIMTSRRHS